MTRAETWLIIAGFLLMVSGLVLRTILMMRSSDATPRGARVLHGRELLRQYRQLFPHSATPRLTQSALLCGAALLLAGMGLEIARQL